MILSIKHTNIKKNGVVRPKDGTITGDIWLIADNLTDREENGSLLKDVFVSACVKKGFFEPTVIAQYVRWCKFNALTPISVKKYKRRTINKTVGVRQEKWEMFSKICATNGVRWSDVFRSLIDNVNSGKIEIK